MTSRKPFVAIRRAPAANPALVEQFIAAGADRPAFPSSPAPFGGAPETLDSPPAGLLDAQAPAPLDVQEPGPSEAQSVERRDVPALGIPAIQDSERAGVQALEMRRARPLAPPDIQTPGRAPPHKSGAPEGEAADAPDAQPSMAARSSKQPAPAPGHDPAATPPTPAATRRGLVHRQDGRVRRRMTVYLPPELVGELTAICVYDGRELSDAIADAVRAYLERP